MMQIKLSKIIVEHIQANPADFCEIKNNYLKEGSIWDFDFIMPNDNFGSTLVWMKKDGYTLYLPERLFSFKDIVGLKIFKSNEEN